ncbi:50S ribosomal protein L24 [Candidatus Parvarchaeota archaeon]|jgi:large subunit ribosomal protein L24|nr:50S ribosomal protein L24 [Candidatus Parvarchaeota archaeon]MCL5976370.1 50S ribosomal protein L24 [Candidatus Parvarchaeota archaeon]
MKNNFSRHWVSSTSPKKQRKYRTNAPLHIKRKMLSAHLSKELRAKYKTRNIVLKKGDTVLITRGKFKGNQGKIDKVYTKQLKVSIDSAKNVTKKGNKVPFKIRPSALTITDLNLSDARRLEKIESYGKAR